MMANDLPANTFANLILEMVQGQIERAFVANEQQRLGILRDVHKRITKARAHLAGITAKGAVVKMRDCQGERPKGEVVKFGQRETV